MNFETTQKKEQSGKNREKLLALEKTGKYVFHGSPDVIDKLEPRQAYNYNATTDELEPDGAPAVFATQFADMAIFRSLITEKDVPEDSTSRFGIDENQLHFAATQNLLDLAKNRTGKIYVLAKQQFDVFEGMQCRSAETITPIEVIEVTAADLPPNIEIIK